MGRVQFNYARTQNMHLNYSLDHVECMHSFSLMTQYWLSLLARKLISTFLFIASRVLGFHLKHTFHHSYYSSTTFTIYTIHSPQKTHEFPTKFFSSTVFFPNDLSDFWCIIDLQFRTPVHSLMLNAKSNPNAKFHTDIFNHLSNNEMKQYLKPPLQFTVWFYRLQITFNLMTHQLQVIVHMQFHLR